jgi:hypothetical protein
MGRGMGDTQKRILGVAYTINAHTQCGIAKVKSTTRSKGRFQDKAMIWEGVPDINSNLGVFAVYGLVPNPRPIKRVSRGHESIYEMHGMLWNSKHNPEARKAQIAVCKARNSLRTRGLLRYASCRGVFWGDILTSDGVELGSQFAVDVPEIDLAITVFLTTNPTTPEWRVARDELIRRCRLLQPIT